MCNLLANPVQQWVGQRNAAVRSTYLAAAAGRAGGQGEDRGRRERPFEGERRLPADVAHQSVGRVGWMCQLEVSVEAAHMPPDVKQRARRREQREVRGLVQQGSV